MPGELDLSGMRFKSTSGLNDVVSLAFHIHASRFSAPMTVSNYELVGDSMDPCRMQVATAEIAGAKVEITRPIGSPGVITFKMQSCGKDSGHKKK